MRELISMSRSAPFRRTCPEIVQKRIEYARELQFFVVQELGPMAFIIKEPNAPSPSPDSVTANRTGRKFKVGLGSLQTCTCSSFMKDGELCHHTLWVMLKVFGVPQDSDILYQQSLVEREIAELMRYRNHRRPTLPPPEASPKTSSETSSEAGIPPRPIQENDICPICQEELISSSSSLTYCKTSCGNHMHVKCVRVLMEHQSKSMGLDTVKCPLCRKDLGTVEELKTQLSAEEKGDRQKRKEKTRKPALHKGTSCQECGCLSIVGKCHRCTVCQSYHLCDKCFTSGAHSDHTFTHRSRPNSPSRLSPRRVAPTFPQAVLEDMQTRELGDADYEALLALDSPGVNQGDIPLHVVNGFPTDRAVGKNWVGDSCKVCMQKIQTGDVVRKIPCSHGFHRNCIDRWLLQCRTTCPTCGLAAYSSITADSIDTTTGVGDPIDLNAANYQAAKYPDKTKRKKKRKEKKAVQQQSSEEHTRASDSSLNAMIIFGSRSELMTKLNPEEMQICIAGDHAFADQTGGSTSGATADSVMNAPFSRQTSFRSPIEGKMSPTTSSDRRNKQVLMGIRGRQPQSVLKATKTVSEGITLPPIHIKGIHGICSPLPQKDNPNPNPNPHKARKAKLRPQKLSFSAGRHGTSGQDTSLNDLVSTRQLSIGPQMQRPLVDM
ncbi:uncharacterized protein SPPG_02292 [Spizellomyces punctatus DAOM BR117]|uniref:RING-type domain-containing protein n=1 Tax=Spizellomyces punctatus (strain DAOM BR117) TaxID=645134 RepID=A0A0L0HQX5_SPIPD|nr:uncharacterized protein SPPG_02292 [Spizellomyces punctatus DAOM BR117]KND03239.1 hypothetical protein SPPG_02292 [Spizellomyces punctatus DAOM BR117]|eukprot:XP_016611278.1 hypothetical protein SPPG_02292 [Spizellomyces punctatus DAOM BR117]